MSTSRVSFRDGHFEANDAVLEVILKLMSAEVSASKSPPAWLQEAKSDWDLLATQEFGFGAAPELDNVVTDNERATCIRDLLRRVADRIHEMGDPIPADRLNSLGTGQPNSLFTADVSAKPFREGILAFIKLLSDKG